MTTAVFVILAIFFAILALLAFGLYRTQRAAVISVLHNISNMEKGQYSRRTDPLTRGPAGELSRAANSLAEALETRSAKAAQDKDHLQSLLALLDHTNEIALATDNMDMIRLANAAAARVLGRSAESLIGKHIDTVIHNPDLRTLYKNAFSSTAPVSAQIALQIPGRTLHCQATAATIYAASHYRGTLLVLRDITEIARALQMKTDFATNASHELRTPLASIRAAVETIKESTLFTDDRAGDGADSGDKETVRRCIEIINNHVLRLQLMVQDLLDLSRAEDTRALVRSDSIDLQLVCEALAAAVNGQLQDKHLALKLDLAPDAHSMVGDERLITLTLKNLVDNAIKFTPKGSITIRSYRRKTAALTKNGDAHTPADQTASPAPAEDAPTLPETNELILEVQDTGIGIPTEDQERVFERFYTVNRSRGGADRGTGLGLSIVKHAVNAMHGIVTLASTPNEGTTLRCAFPLDPPKKPA
jgi:two-component system phosphate regulon sensor histidine kinase PhoR